MPADESAECAGSAWQKRCFDPVVGPGFTTNENSFGGSPPGKFSNEGSRFRREKELGKYFSSSSIAT
jgi:hypothetical protein